MKFTADAARLVPAIRQAVALTAPHSPYPAYKVILFEARDDAAVTLTATNGEQLLSVSVPAAVGERGDACLVAAPLAQAAAFLEGAVAVAVDATQASVSDDNGRFAAARPSLRTEHYPRLGDRGDEHASFEVDGNALGHAIRLVEPNVPQNAAPGSADGLTFDLLIGDGHADLAVVGHDAHGFTAARLPARDASVQRCAVEKTEHGDRELPGRFVATLPPAAVKTSFALARPSGVVRVRFDAGSAALLAEDWSYHSVLTTFKRPEPWRGSETFLPTAGRVVADLDTGPLADAVARVSACASGEDELSHKAVVLEFAGDAVTACGRYQAGESVASAPLTSVGHAGRFRVAAVFLLPHLKSLAGEATRLVANERRVHLAAPGFDATIALMHETH